jgi:hypothetical protein
MSDEERESPISGKLSDYIFSQCLFCKHWQPGAKCSAFHGGIPADILRNWHDHHQPYPGDHGILFEPLEGITVPPLKPMGSALVCPE